MQFIIYVIVYISFFLETKRHYLQKIVMEDLMPHLAKIKAPFGQEKVYKEECAFSFDNPVSTDRMEKIVHLKRIEEYFFENICEYLFKRIFYIPICRKQKQACMCACQPFLALERSMWNGFTIRQGMQFSYTSEEYVKK